MAGFAAARLADLIGILRSRAHPKNISDWYVRVELAGCGNVIRNVNEKIGKKLADLCVGHPARVSTESGIGVKVIEPICHVKRDVVCNRIWKLRLMTSDFANPFSNSSWIDFIHHVRRRLTKKLSHRLGRRNYGNPKN